MRSIAAVSLALFVVALGSFGCESASKDDADLPKPESAVPEALLAVVELPSGTDVSQVAAFAGTINPQFGALAKTMAPTKIAEFLGEAVTSVESLDLSKPIRLFVVDPKLAADGFVVLVVSKKSKVKAKAEMAVLPITENVVAIGEAKVIAAIDNYAAHVVGQKVESPRAVAFPKHLLATFAKEIDGFAGQMKATGLPATVVNIVEAELRLAKVIGNDSEEISLAIAGGSDDPHLALKLVAKSDTELAKWFALQSPAEFSMHERLPELADASMFFEGSLHAGQLADMVPELMAQMFRGGAFGGNKEAVMAAVKTLMGVMTGDFVMTGSVELGAPMQMPEMAMVTFYGVSDGDKARAAMGEMMAKMTGTHTMMGMEQTVVAEPNAAEHAGVAISRQTTVTVLPTGGAPIEQRVHYAVLDDGGYYAMGDDGESLVRAAIDRSQGKGPAFEPSPVMDAALARAKTDGASMVMLMDFSSIGAPVPVPPIAMSAIFGERSGTMTFRFAR